MARLFSVFAMSLSLCIASTAPAEEPAPPSPVATTEQVHKTVARAIGYLQTESASWLSTRKCAACHHAPLALWALNEADQRGYAIDKKYVADTMESLLGSREKLLASRIFPNPADTPDPRPQGRGAEHGAPIPGGRGPVISQSD